VRMMSSFYFAFFQKLSKKVFIFFNALVLIMTFCVTPWKEGNAKAHRNREREKERREKERRREGEKERRREREKERKREREKERKREREKG